MPLKQGQNGSWQSAASKVAAGGAFSEATVKLGEGGSWTTVSATGGGLPTSSLTDIADHIWYMDEGSSGSTADSVGSADGTINGPTWVTGSGGAGDAYLTCDGSDGIINCGNIFDTQDAVTVSVWGELTSSDDDSYVVQQGVTNGFLIWDPGANDEIQPNVNGSVPDPVPISPGWHMYSLTIASDGSAAFYVDDVQERTWNPGVPSWNSSNAFTFGNREDLARPWNDGVDMGVVAYQEATASEISDHYQATQDRY